MSKYPLSLSSTFHCESCLSTGRTSEFAIFQDEKYKCAQTQKRLHCHHREISGKTFETHLVSFESFAKAQLKSRHIDVSTVTRTILRDTNHFDSIVVNLLDEFYTSFTFAGIVIQFKYEFLWFINNGSICVRVCVRVWG